MTIIEVAQALLFEAEGPNLDFKREQYRFAGANDSDKAEFLKDVLAFANAFRRAEAYIFVGVEEVQGGPANVVGVSEHLEDADLQQFVNSKTNRPVDFSYRAIELNGKKVALICVALQRRPLYLTKNYGGLLKDSVYIRRGSSTAVASPDEIAQMGVSVSAMGDSVPALTFSLGDGDNLSILAQPVTVDLRRVILPADFKVPDFKRDEDSDPLRTIRTTRTRPQFFRELVDYYSIHEAVESVGFAVRNDGTVPALDVDALVEIDDPSDDLIVMVDNDLPNLPKAAESIYTIPAANLPADVFNADVVVRKIDSYWRTEASFGKIRPKETVWSSCKVCVGAPTSRTVVLRVRLHGDNLPEPVEFEQTLTLRVTDCPETLESLIQRYVDEAGADGESEDDDEP